MEKDDLLKFCKYYKGEAVSPYKDRQSSLFWDIEKQYILNAMRNHDFHTGWISEARKYIKEHKGENNILTGDTISIEQKGVIIYIETMLSKWCPYEIDMIFKY